jgi:hypothetical protein
MDPVISDIVQSVTLNASDPQDAKLLAAAASHVDPMSEPVVIHKKFTTSTWHQNTSIWKLITETNDPFKVVLYDLMYHGPLPQKEGKLPFISSWQQRMCALAYCFILPFFRIVARHFSSLIDYGVAAVLSALMPMHIQADRILLLFMQTSGFSHGLSRQ